MIEVKNISKRYGNTVVLDNVSLHVESGELLALLGPSGSGKTTLLRIIAGMEVADSGSVFINGREVGRQKAGERRVGFVFQHYALFKHMTVFENVAFGLRVRPRAQRPDEPTLRRKVMDLLELVHLDNFYDRYPSQLSGGQRQRVALARALAVEPQLLLLDEPFGALDSKVRKELRRWMRRLHDDIHITSIFVTHDQEEAMEVSDRVVVMSNGKIEQVGTPDEVYHKPANSFVYDFLGNYNVFEGWRDEEGNTHLLEVEPREAAFVQTSPAPQRSTGWMNRYPEISHLIRKLLPGFGSDSVLPAKKKRSKDTAHKTPVKLFARPHELYIMKTPDDEEYIFARVIHINPAGPLFKVEMESRGGNILTAEVPKEVIDMLSISKNDTVYVRPKNTRVFDDVIAGA